MNRFIGRVFLCLATVCRHASHDLNPVNVLSLLGFITANGVYLFDLVDIFVTTSDSENRSVLKLHIIIEWKCQKKLMYV